MWNSAGRRSSLEIERARFEERLRATIDVPDTLRNIKIPALLIQPLVENAIKHGISPLRAGGEVVITARLAKEKFQTANNGSAAGELLHISVRDTGAGASASELERGRQFGVGLSNVEQRIRQHFGDAGFFAVDSAPGIGKTIELGIPFAASKSFEAATGGSTRKEL